MINRNIKNSAVCAWCVFEYGWDEF